MIIKISFVTSQVAIGSNYNSLNKYKSSELMANPEISSLVADITDSRELTSVLLKGVYDSVIEIINSTEHVLSNNLYLEMQKENGFDPQDVASKIVHLIKAEL